MDQKNRLLREAYIMLRAVATGDIRPLRSLNETAVVLALKDRIAKNLKITPATEV